MLGYNELALVITLKVSLTFWERIVMRLLIHHHRKLTYLYLRFIAVGAFLLSVNAAIASNDEPTTEPQHSEAFQALLEDAANPEKSFNFAKKAIEAGNLTEAIAAFERILQINPGLANIKLELGVLYLRVGANELAAQMINEALQSPDIPIIVRNRAKQLYKLAIDEASPHSFTFKIGLGGHYDENANAAPSSRRVLVGGQTGLLDEENTGREDTSVSFRTSFQHVYTFDSQSGNQLETNLSSYSRRYDKSSEINLDAARIDVGPRFFIGSILDPSASIRPSIGGAITYLDGDKYQQNIEGGLNTRRFFTETLIGGLNLKVNDQKFFNSSTRSNATDRNGTGYGADISLLKEFATSTQGFVNLGISRRDADKDYESRDHISANLGVSQRYKAPFSLRQWWRTSLSAGLTSINYDEPDPAVDPNETREDTRLDLYWTNTFVFSKSFYTTLTIYFTDNESTLPNFEYDNTGASLTLWTAF